MSYVFFCECYFHGLCLCSVVIYAGDKSTNLALSFLFSSARDYFSHCRFYALSESRFLFLDFSPALYNMQVLLISRCDSWHVLHPLHNPHRFLISCDATGADAELLYVFRASRLLMSQSVPHFLQLSSSLSSLAPPRGKLTVRVSRLDIEASQETPKTLLPTAMNCDVDVKHATRQNLNLLSGEFLNVFFLE